MGNWRLEEVDRHQFALYHYETLMLEWVDSDGRAIPIHTDTGKGSVTDQQMMNAAFDVLGMKLRYHRKKGADISAL